MTGMPGRPMRAGSSVNDIMGGMFGVIGILAALNQRHTTGRGRLVQAGLFENCVLLVAQHMAQIAVTGVEPRPMSERAPAWPVYDIFEVSDGQVFVAVVTATADVGARSPPGPGSASRPRAAARAGTPGRTIW